MSYKSKAPKMLDIQGLGQSVLSNSGKLKEPESCPQFTTPDTPLPQKKKYKCCLFECFTRKD